MLAYFKFAFLLSIISITLSLVLFFSFGGQNQNEYSIYGSIFSNLMISFSVAIFFYNKKYEKNRFSLSILFSSIIYGLTIYIFDYAFGSTIENTKILLISLLHSSLIIGLATILCNVKAKYINITH